MRALFGKTFDLLSGMLDFRAERHKVIASNIANIETGNYKPKELNFQKNFEEAKQGAETLELIRTHKMHFPFSSDVGKQFQLTQSGDKVEIDREMANLAENNLMYNLTVELISRKFKGIDTALKEIR
jgi:flagellar basal-body rod protein FlgB